MPCLGKGESFPERLLMQDQTDGVSLLIHTVQAGILHSQPGLAAGEHILLPFYRVLIRFNFQCMVKISAALNSITTKSASLLEQP